MTLRAGNGLLTTDQAAAVLGVKPTTIYTYVSRGMIRPVRIPGDKVSRFHPEDIDRLAARTSRSRARRPAQSEGIDSSVTLIDGRHYWYRGQDPARLATEASFEQVAELLWHGIEPPSTQWPPPDRLPDPAPIRGAVGPEALPLDRLRVGTSVMAAADHLRFGRDPSSVVETARRLISTLVEWLPIRSEPIADGIAARLLSRLRKKPGDPESVHAIGGALIVLADHGLAPSTRAARMAAAYRADLYGVVQAGLGVMAGAWHGGRSLSAESMLLEIEDTGDVEAVVGRFLRRGGVPCLGHPRYPDGDPRTAIVIDLIHRAEGDHRVVRAMAEIDQITIDRRLPRPTVELGLAALTRALELDPGASEAIFAVGRMAGWIAHAIEAFQSPSPALATCRYVGPAPRT